MRQGFHILRIVAIVCAFLCAGRFAGGQTNVYSVDAVGYVQVAFAPGYTFCCNPLNTTNNTVANLFPKAPDSSAVYLWDLDAQRFSAPAVYHNGWSSNYTLAMGKGFVFYTPTLFTNTFVGEVLQGQLSNPIAGNNRLSLIGSLVPQAASLNVLAVPGSDGDSAYMPLQHTRSLSDAYSYFAGFGWFDPSGVVDTNGPVLPVASCFFIQHAGPDTNWVRTFYVNNAMPIAAKIKNIRLSDNIATLNISVPSGASYSVQTSPDRITWTTIATNQTASVWTHNVAAMPAAYFRLR